MTEMMMMSSYPHYRHHHPHHLPLLLLLLLLSLLALSTTSSTTVVNIELLPINEIYPFLGSLLFNGEAESEAQADDGSIRELLQPIKPDVTVGFTDDGSDLVLRIRSGDPVANRWRVCMRLAPGWDAPHCISLLDGKAVGSADTLPMVNGLPHGTFATMNAWLEEDDNDDSSSSGRTHIQPQPPPRPPHPPPPLLPKQFAFVSVPFVALQHPPFDPPATRVGTLNSTGGLIFRLDVQRPRPGERFGGTMIGSLMLFEGPPNRCLLCTAFDLSIAAESSHAEKVEEGDEDGGGVLCLPPEQYPHATDASAVRNILHDDDNDDAAATTAAAAEASPVVHWLNPHTLWSDELEPGEHTFAAWLQPIPTTSEHLHQHQKHRPYQQPISILSVLVPYSTRRATAKTATRGEQKEYEFLHIPKTGGTALAYHLNKCTPSAGIHVNHNSCGTFGEAECPGYSSNEDLPKHRERVDESAHMLTIIRNPVEQVVSHLTYWRSGTELSRSHIDNGGKMKPFTDEQLREEVDTQLANSNMIHQIGDEGIYAYVQKRLEMSSKKEVLTRILCTETLSVEVPKLMREWGYECTPDDTFTPRHVSSAKSALDVLTADQIARIYAKTPIQTNLWREHCLSP
jgi:hypothetical protein